MDVHKNRRNNALFLLKTLQPIAFPENAAISHALHMPLTAHSE